jgi:hypothetical protein
MMNGLFGSSMDDPKTLATLQLVGGLLSAPRFGQGLSQGLMGYSDTLMRAKQQQAAEQMQRMRLEQMQQQMEQQRAQAEQQQRDRTAMQRQFQPLPGPSMDGGPVMPRFDAGSMLGQGASPDAVMQALQLQQAMAPKQKAPIKLGEGDQLLDPDTFKAVAQNPKQVAPEKDPEDIRVLKMIYGEGTPAYMQALQQLGRKRTSHQPGTTVHVGGDKEFGKVFAGEAAKMLGESRDQAKAAASTLQSLGRMEQALKNGALIGPTSKFQTFGLQLGEMMGVAGKDGQEKLANTRTMIQGAAQLNLDGAAALKGQGQVTEFERKLVEKAAGGGVDEMTAPEMTALIGVLRKVNSAKVSGHADRLKRVHPQFSPFVPFYEVPMPQDEQAAPAPAVRRYNPQTGKIE